LSASIPERLLVAAPFVATSLFYALTPEMTRLVRERVVGRLPTASKLAPSSAIPPHLSPEYIGDYLEYSIDAAQVLPTFALPIMSTVLAVTQGLTVLGTALLLVLGVPWLVWIGLRVLLADPVSYVAKKYLRRRYTFLPIAGIALNLVAAIVVIALSS
jgi:hypothetical protein